MNLELQKGSRSKFLAIVVLGLMAIFVVRLFYLQVVQHDYYVAKANAEQIRRDTIPAKRGEIFAMDGSSPFKLVMNETVYTLYADPKTIKEKDRGQIKEVIRQVAGGNLRSNVDDLLAKTETRYQILGTKLNRKQAELIKKENLGGIGFQETTQRVYPEGGLAAQTLGFVNAESKGQYGAEANFDDRLRGKDGLLQSVADVSDVPLTIGNNNINKPAVNGDDVVLTIDRNVQSYAEKALAAGLQRTKAEKGSVMVMDPNTGKIMAMANLPTYKPAEFTKVQDGDAFNNAAVSSPYEPGSVIKTLTVATGLDKNVIQPDSTYNNTDKIKVGDRTIENLSKGRTGNITIQKALNDSLNTGMVTIAQRLGDGSSVNQTSRDIMYDYFHERFGLGKRTGIEVTGEVGGTVVKPDNSNGAAVSYATMSFGQGMNVTMVQVCAAFASIINGGTYYSPTVYAGVMNGDSLKERAIAATRSNVISADASLKARSMIKEARQVYYSKSDKSGYEVGGKTGTSQTIVNGQYSNDQTIGSYIGYGGDSAPKYVIMVQVSGKNMNMQGGRDAMPIFTDISNWMIDYLKLQPQQ